ncbi:hypothetical protein [Quadrisphaera sp. KR29]|uniref:hypothetical protein n=1 Tax=Quadrisphaera sp. KR29 TaxID=3461391 RepID=UPI00404514F3
MTAQPQPSAPDQRQRPAASAAPRVLFVCVRDGGGSQMAAGLVRHAAAVRDLHVE